MKAEGIGCRPIKQEAWFKQIESMMSSSIRLIDRLSVSEILTMYHEGSFLCDRCGEKLNRNEYDPTLEYHILHMINPRILWLCELCVNDDIMKGRIISSLPR